jgi:hypothetical protein
MLHNVEWNVKIVVNTESLRISKEVAVPLFNESPRKAHYQGQQVGHVRLETFLSPYTIPEHYSSIFDRNLVSVIKK